MLYLQYFISCILTYIYIYTYIDVSTECDAAGMVKAIAEVADLNHPHLLLPMGVAIQREMPIYIVYSFMTNGDVKNFLKYNSKGKVCVNV